MVLPNTPFPTNGYYGPVYFCNRMSEVKRIQDCIYAGSSLTMVSLRRMGKSALLHHFAHLSQKKVATIYVDLYPTTSLFELEAALAAAIVATLFSTGKKAIELITDFAKTLGASVKFAADGTPSVQISSGRVEGTHQTLTALLKFTEQYHKPVVIAFDEFQQVAYYSAQNIEATIRAQMQTLKNTTFIFAGSNKALLEAMFSDHKRPLYQSTQHLHLEPIPEAEYCNFIQEIFVQHKRKITREACEYVYNACEGRTFHVQQLCQRLFTFNNKTLSTKEAQQVLDGVLAEQAHLYERFKNMLTPSQWNVLSTIANQRVIQAPYASEMLRLYGTSSQSTAQRVYEALLERELIYQDKNGYRVEDPFLAKWICKTFPR